MLEVKFVNELSGSNLDAPIRSIAQYLTQPNRKLIIPPWQREYVWQVGENGEVGDLLNDLKEFIENGQESYLIGSIITCEEPKGSGNFWLIDGQQRTLTFLIFLMAAGFPTSELVSIQELIDAQNSDLFDVLEFVKYALKPITRTKRASTSRSIMEEGIDAKQLEFIDFLVTQYIESGVGELDESKLETLLEIKYSDVFNAVQTLGKGDVGKVRKLFLDFQKNLYLPHKEYQRVS